MIRETDLVFEQKPEGGLTTPLQSEVENPRLEFRDGQFFFRMTNLEGGVIERYVSDAAVREAFSRVPIDSGWLRPEVARWGDGKHGESAVAFFPPAVYELEVSNEAPVTTADGGPQTDGAEQDAGRMPALPGTPAVDGQPSAVEAGLDRLSVPLPSLVWFGMGTNYYIFAVKTEKLEPYHEIYRAPLPNVYTSGEVCWGLVKPPRANARSIFQAFELFIKSTFNNHLASGKSKRAGEDVRTVLRDLSGQWAVCSGQAEEAGRMPALPAYPVEDLLRQVDRVGVTLDKALREFMETGVMAE